MLPLLLNYSSEIAPTGHAAWQAPQSIHWSGFTCAVLSKVIAPTGHSPVQVPQEMQTDSSTFLGISKYPPFANLIITLY